MVIGKVSALTPHQTRAIARDRLGQVAKGDDPSANRRALRHAVTVAEICDWYLEEGEAGRLIGRRRRAIKASTLAMDRSRIGRHVKPLIGEEPVAGLSVPRLEKMQAEIAAGRTALERPKGRGGTTRGGDAVAGRTLGMLSTIFEHAVRSRLIASNPAKGSRQITARKRSARLSLEQLSALGAAMRTDGESATGVAVIRLMALTGFRRNEALAVRRSWVMDAGGVMRRMTQQKDRMGLFVRTIGLKRAETKIGLVNLVYNMKRLMWLEGRRLTRA